MPFKIQVIFIPKMPHKIITLQNVLVFVTPELHPANSVKSSVN